MRPPPQFDVRNWVPPLLPSPPLVVICPHTNSFCLEGPLVEEVRTLGGGDHLHIERRQQRVDELKRLCVWTYREMKRDQG